MADDQDPSNDVNDDGGEFDYEELTTAVPPAPGPVAVQTTTVSLVDGDYDDDEPIEDYVVNLIVNEKPDGLPSGLGDVVTDRYGNTIYDSLNTISTTVYDELNGNGTAITGGKTGWFGWSTAKLLLVGLIALCILGIILAAIFFVISKKFKKNQRTTTTTTGSTTTTKAAVTKGISPDPKYQPVPNV